MGVRALLGMVAAAGLLGCPGPAPCLQFPAEPGTLELPPELFVAGHPAHLSLVAPQPARCLPERTGRPGDVFGPFPGPRIEVTSAAATLQGPSLAQVPVTARAQASGAQVDFTPLAPGRYHLEVAFGPSLGSVQADLLVTADRTAELRLLPAPCDRLEQTRGGALICDDVVYLDGGRLAGIAGADGGWHRAVAEAVWSFQGDQVWRSVETDAGVLTRSPANAVRLPGGAAVSLLADRQLALVRGATELTRVVVDGGTLQLQGSRPAAEQFYAQGWTQSGPAGWRSDGRLCPITVESGVPCAQVSSVCGISDGLVWAVSDKQQLLAASFVDGGLVTRDFVALGTGLLLFAQSNPDGPCVVSSFSGHPYVPRWSAGGIVLDDFEAPGGLGSGPFLPGPSLPGPSVLRATGTLVFRPSGDGGTLYAPR